MGKSPEHMAWRSVSHSRSLKTAERPREAWAQIWDHLKLLYTERLTALSSLSLFLFSQDNLAP